MKELEAPVVIAGGGSVGLTLAAELGTRGIGCVLVEEREQVNAHPRANAVANRTMEFYRRWGVDRQLIGRGVPADYPADYHWVSTLHGHRLHTLSLPSHAQLEQARAGGVADPYAEAHWSPYLKTICGQQHVDQALRDHVETLPRVRTRYGWRVIDFDEHDEGVVVRIRHVGTGEEASVRAEYLVGCDGGRSTVREQLGIPMSGREGMARFVSIYFRSPQLMQAHAFGPGTIYFPLHIGHRGFLLNWDTGRTWTYHLILADGENWRDVDPVARIHALAGRPVEVEVIELQPWTAHATVADCYGRGRVYLAGDAAHKFTPTGGLGMNTGVADAVDLGWKLAAVLDGWAPAALLRSYHIERHPIGVRNTREAADNFDQLYAVMQDGDELDAPTPEGERLRGRLGERIQGQEKLLASSGVLLGYRYEGSPICVGDGTPAPADDPRRYVPTARPGHRAPHLWVTSERSILDLLGPDFTLLALGDAPDVEAFRRAADAQRLPLRIVHLPDARARALYAHDYVLVRPDLMVAWRGDGAEGIEAVLRIVVGHGLAASADRDRSPC